MGFAGYFARCRTSVSVRLFDSFVNLDPCVEDGFFFFFGAWIRRIRPIFSLPQLAFDLTSTPTIPDSCRQRSSISLTAVPRNHIKHSFRKAGQLWTLSKLHSPCHYFEKRKKNNNNKAKVFQHPIDSQSASCSLISRHVLSELGRGAASFLATESTGTVLIPRLMTRIAGHRLGLPHRLQKISRRLDTVPCRAVYRMPGIVSVPARWLLSSPVSTVVVVPAFLPMA